jgi:hypothetical protein
MREFVLVHGARHGSRCRSAVVEHLAARDVPSVAVDLEGLGLDGRRPRAWWARPFDPRAVAAGGKSRRPSGPATLGDR